MLQSQTISDPFEPGTQIVFNLCQNSSSICGESLACKVSTRSGQVTYLGTSIGVSEAASSSLGTVSSQKQKTIS